MTDTKPSAAEPPAVGTAVVDTARGQVGEVRDVQYGHVYLRPFGGGREWPAEPGFVRTATPTEVLSAQVDR
ncbi:hypothetical protein GT204_01160 [Streptomyces sp. SID4919]|uniref:hypothetical protein n=1 Tax=unclassified Streptomyces TaxID=2593676 RepID=UPI000823B1A4|nr:MULTISPECIES: hypothetical protein [unclassified Streptomyces]MYY07537.1 hypothetical protein [Streptomyces sp. SID4919]SCK62871.1 hypothetical protein YW7DRAFT_06866 [Streptomyces sp. AmelKG-E11A]